MTKGKYIAGHQMYECLMYGSEEPVMLKEKDIPLVVLQEFSKLGSLENHQEVHILTTK